MVCAFLWMHSGVAIKYWVNNKHLKANLLQPKQDKWVTKCALIIGKSYFIITGSDMKQLMLQFSYWCFLNSAVEYWVLLGRREFLHLSTGKLAFSGLLKYCATPGKWKIASECFKDLFIFNQRALSVIVLIKDIQQMISFRNTIKDIGRPAGRDSIE